MKAKLSKDYLFSPNGLEVINLKKGTIVSGDIAKTLIKQKLAKETKLDDDIVQFNDNGFVVAEEPTTSSDSNSLKQMTEVLEQLKSQEKRIDDLEQFASKMLVEQVEQLVGDEEVDHEKVDKKIDDKTAPASKK